MLRVADSWPVIFMSVPPLLAGILRPLAVDDQPLDGDPAGGRS
jgi:hypothetical protein